PVPLMRDEVRDLFLPELLSGASEGGQVNRFRILQGDEQPLAVAGHARRGLRALLVLFLFDVALMDVGLPDLRSGFAVVAQHRLNLLFFIARRQEDLVADDRGGTMSAAG